MNTNKAADENRHFFNQNQKRGREVERIQIIFWKLIYGPFLRNIILCIINVLLHLCVNSTSELFWMFLSTSDFFQHWFRKIIDSCNFSSETRPNITKFGKILFLTNDTIEKCSCRISCNIMKFLLGYNWLWPFNRNRVNVINSREVYWNEDGWFS